MTVNLQAVDNESFISDVFLNVHRILNEEVTEVTALGNQTIQLVEHDTGKKWIGAFPDNYLEERADFPVGVIRTPNTSDVRRGFDFSEEYYTFELHVYASRAEHPPLIISKAWDALKRYEDELSSAGLYSLTHGQTTTDMIMRGEIKTHEMVMPVTVRRVRC